MVNFIPAAGGKHKPRCTGHGDDTQPNDDTTTTVATSFICVRFINLYLYSNAIFVFGEQHRLNKKPSKFYLVKIKSNDK